MKWLKEEQVVMTPKLAKFRFEVKIQSLHTVGLMRY